MVFLNCVAIALIVYEVGYLGLLLLNNLEVIPSVFKLFTRSEIFVSYFIYNLKHFNKKNDRTYTIDAIQILQMFAEKVSVSANVKIIHLNSNQEI